MAPIDGSSAEDKLVRLERLRSLRLTAAELSATVGGRESYWHDMLRGDKAFGEKIARKIEDRRGLPRGWLDLPPSRGPDHWRRVANTLAARYKSMDPAKFLEAVDLLAATIKPDAADADLEAAVALGQQLLQRLTTRK